MVQIINDLFQISLDTDSFQLEKVIGLRNKLEDYVIYHFEKEEDLMMKKSLAKKFVEYLIRWLAYHVLNTDKSLVRQMEWIGSGECTPEEAYEREKQQVDSSTEPLLKALKIIYRLVSAKSREIEQHNMELEERVRIRTKELEEANRKLKEISFRDALTNLPNRRYVMNEIERMIYEYKRYKTEFSVLFIDIDKFKKVNDI